MISKVRGYSLLEMLITLAIVAILSGVSYVWYSGHLASTRRANAELVLLKLQSGLENYYLEHKTYEGASLQNIKIDDNLIQGYYRLNIKLDQNGQSYEAQAIPIGQQAIADQDCGTLILATDGRRSYAGKDSEATCW